METLSGFWHTNPVAKFLNWLPFDGANAVFNGQLAICVCGDDVDFVWTGVCADARAFRVARIVAARLPDRFAEDVEDVLAEERADGFAPPFDKAEARFPDFDDVEVADWVEYVPVRVFALCPPPERTEVDAARLADFLPEAEDFAFDTEERELVRAEVDAARLADLEEAEVDAARLADFRFATQTLVAKREKTKMTNNIVTKNEHPNFFWCCIALFPSIPNIPQICGFAISVYKV